MTYSDLFDVHSDSNFSSSYTSPKSSTTTYIDNVGFVDDTTITYNDFCCPAPLPKRILLSCGQFNTQFWKNYLNTSGGDLEDDKTKLFLLTWAYSNTGFPYLDDNSHLSFELYSDNPRSSHTVPVLPNSQAFKTLGFHLAMDQSSSTQLSTLMNKCLQKAHAVASSSATHREALIAYFAIFFPSLT